MRVGLNVVLRDSLTSVAHVQDVYRDVVSERHEVVPLPEDYYDVSPSRRRKMAEEILGSCDVMLSPADPTLLRVRAWSNAPVPLAVLMFGNLGRGSFGLQSLVDTLRASDVLVPNCRADMAIAHNMFPNATVRVLPFAYREEKFYPPPAEETAAMRVRLGIPSRAPTVLYAGRCTVEKNVHSVLKVFSVVRAAIPEAHLMLAGPIDDVRFGEFGVFPLHMASVMDRMIRRLGLSGRVHYAGPLGADDLRAVYGAADVMLNLSLHHDENFGLGQVEAMACGTPVVGTRWGGLQDTITHGETGYHVSTMVTGNGVKSNWWEAANRVVELLRDPERRSSFGQRGVEVAREQFSRVRHADMLDTILEDAVYGTRRIRELLRVTDFARDLWASAKPNTELLPPARRGPEAFALYRHLIAPYTGITEDGLDGTQPLSAEQVVLLANPVEWAADDTLAVNDAQFPMDVAVPAELDEAVRMAVDALAEEPVTTVGALLERMGHRAREGLEWMVEAGLVLRAHPSLDAVDPALARGPATTPLVSIRRVEHPADIVYVA